MTLEGFLAKSGKIASNTSIEPVMSLDSSSQTGLLPSPSIDELLDAPLPDWILFWSGDIEETKRLRQKIKNKEFVARPRARKQAYLDELETTVSHLEEENSKLRKEKGSFASLEDMTLEDFLAKSGKIASNTSIEPVMSLDSSSRTGLLPSPSIDELLDAPLPDRILFWSGDIEETKRLRQKIKNMKFVARPRPRKQAKQCTTADASSKEEGKTQRGKIKIGVGLNLEDLEPHFGKRLEDVAEELDVGRSTIKRARRNYGIIRWPCNKKHKNNPTNEISCRGSQQNMHTSTSSKNITVKVKFEDDIIKFDICLSAGIEKLLNEVGRRLNLKVGCFKLKYLDEDDDDILLACDDDLQFYLNSLATVVENTCIKLFINLIHK